MKNIYLILFFLIICLNAINSQNFNNNYPDTAQVKIYIQKADYLENQLEYDSSIYYLCFVTDIISKSLRPDSTQLSGLYYRISVMYSRTGKTEGAILYIQKTLNTTPFELKNDSIYMAGIYNEIAYLYFILDEYENALLYYDKASNIYNSDPDKNAVSLSKVYSNIGTVYYYLGNYELALKNNFTSLTIIQNTLGLTHPYAGMNYTTIALVYTKINEFDQAELYYKKANAILANSLGENHPEIAKLFRNFGLNYYYQKNYDEAVVLLKKAAEINVKLYGDQNIRVADVYNDLAMVFSGKEDFEKAIDYYQLALKIYLEYYGKNYQKIAENYNSIAEMFNKQGRLRKALDFYKKAFDIYNKFLREPHLEYALYYTNIGIIYSKKEDYQKALLYFQKALIANSYNFNDTNFYANPDLTGVISRPDLLVTLREKALTLYRKYCRDKNNPQDLIGSYQTYLLTIRLLGSLRNEQQNQSKKLELNAENKSIFSHVIDITYNLFYKNQEKLREDIFNFVEKSKSDVLYTSINDLNAKKLAGIPDSLLIYEKNLRLLLSFYNTQVQKETGNKEGYDTVKVFRLEEKYLALDKEYEKFIFGLEKKYHRYYELKYQTNVVSYKELQKTLPDSGAVLEYFLGDSNLYILTLTNSDFQIYRQAIDTSFYKLVINFYRSIKKVDTREFADYSYRLFNLLVSPSLKLIRDKKNLIIIPDEYLLYIPFETLISDTPVFNDKELDFSIPEYMIKKYNISYHYSSTLWFNSLEFITKGKELTNGFVGFAPVFRDTKQDTISGRHLPRELQYSEQEVQNILNLFKSKNIQGYAYMNENANEAAFKINTKNYKFIHVASHSIINDKTPSLSSILFYPAFDTVSQEDGILYSAETYDLDLTADLVVLSSCETGIGKLVKGEGLLALSRGFLYSGANNILFSLWNVFDKNTKDLMVEFYTNVLENKSYSSSLREAKLKLINNKSTAFPINWGAFILVGR